MASLYVHAAPAMHLHHPYPLPPMSPLSPTETAATFLSSSSTASSDAASSSSSCILPVPSTASLIGFPLIQSHIPPPPPVPHIAYFPYAPNTAPITCSITYPSSSPCKSRNAYASSRNAYYSTPPPASPRREWLAGADQHTSTVSTVLSNLASQIRPGSATPSSTTTTGSSYGSFTTRRIIGQPSAARRHSSGSSTASSSRLSTRSDLTDSGRATGGLASSLSPMDDHSVTTTPNGTVTDSLPMYEFEIPNSLVGLIIGVKGKTIKELSVRTDVRMLIRQHHSSEKVDTHQICQVRGKRDKINRCLQMLRKRFPPARFPELNLQPVLPPALPTNLADLLNAQPSWLTLPDDVACEAAIVHLIDAGHLFVQQPTHPSFSSLAKLDQYMILLYSQTTGIPELPNPCETGLLCAAPVCKAWFRAVIVMYFPEDDAVLVRFVDYGGYARMPRGDLRQIRTDLVTLPFQATECFLAHVQPVDGTSQWSQEATDFLRELVAGKVVDVTLIGYSVDEKIPVVEIELIEAEGQKVRVDRLLIQNGLAKAADPSKVQRVFGATSTKQRPGLSKQTSVVNGQV